MTALSKAIYTESLDELWFSMHGSDDPNRRLVATTCYLDDSGAEGQTAILGGCVLSKDPFVRLDERWQRMLLPYKIDSLHMADFVRPYGRHVGMYTEFKIHLFTRAVAIIRRLVDYTLAVSVPLDICLQLFSKKFQREILSPYGIAFIGVSQLNIKVALQHRYPDKMAYLMDTGNPYAGQLQFGHALQSAMERLCGSSFTGRLTFENDVNNTALQAADVVSWAARRLSAEGLTNEFTPLTGLFANRYTHTGLAKSPHYFYSVKPESLTQLRETIESRGPKLPTLQEWLNVGSRSTVR